MVVGLNIYKMAILSIERTEEAIVIKLPLDATADYIQNTLNYLRYVQLGVNSELKQSDLDELAAAAKSGCWEKNKARFKGLEGFEDLVE